MKPERFSFSMLEISTTRVLLRRLISNLVHLISRICLSVGHVHTYTYTWPHAHARVRPRCCVAWRRHAAQCNAHPRPNDETVHSRAIWLTTFWKRADPFVGVCWNVGMSDGFCVGRGILHLTGYAGLMMDETGDYACGNHHARCAPFETLVYVHKDTRVYARARACVRAPDQGARSQEEVSREEDSVLSRGIISLRATMMEMNFFEDFFGASIIWQARLIARVNTIAVYYVTFYEILNAFHIFIMLIKI